MGQEKTRVSKKHIEYMIQTRKEGARVDQKRDCFFLKEKARRQALNTVLAFTMLG